ncbi:flagellar biosynthesis regulator FlaF [Puniceibacterium sediminis]|uniref:Flagellar protein FlaF n=1 Tax=Puniceibacterium sediminis TaxID=1608407 RepID=A0A238WTT3_9RHOB|nr:flagellar biosynthesis regulator FlaF [Puniceibacterium sediminis]SNR49905.1 flagellar protein FlaF [Puniceibacterium sediminis]
MNAHSLAQRAYSANAGSTRSERSTEYELIAQVTYRLKTAAQKGKGGFPQLVEALHENRKLWTALAVDVSSSGNDLPQELRARIFYLAEFMQQHTRRVLKREAKVGPILEINVAVLRGLSGRRANK